MSLRIYQNCVLTPGMPFALDEGAAQHVQVMRLTPGDRFTVFNGDGSDYLVELISVSKRAANASVISAEHRHSESPLHIRLGQVMSKGDRMDYAIQKATELGVTEITPLSSERCELRLKELERIEKKTDHWQRIAISACEQSGRSRLPPVHSPISLAQWLEQSPKGFSLILHPQADQNLRSLATLPAPAIINILIGPEGGLSANEVDLARQHGFQTLTLGPRVLRTETAPIAVLSVLQALWGDFV